MNDENEPQAYAIVNPETDSIVEISRDEEEMEKMKEKSIYDKDQMEIRAYYSEPVVDDIVSSVLGMVRREIKMNTVDGDLKKPDVGIILDRINKIRESIVEEKTGFEELTREQEGEDIFEKVENFIEENGKVTKSAIVKQFPELAPQEITIRDVIWYLVSNGNVEGTIDRKYTVRKNGGEEE
jgi:hypothetical protein